MDANNNGVDDGPSWSTSPSNFVDVQDDKTHTIGTPYIFRPYRPNMTVDQIEFSGQLFDYNCPILGNANLGNKSRALKLDEFEIGTEREVHLSYNAGIIAVFTVVRLK